MDHLNGITNDMIYRHLVNGSSNGLPRSGTLVIPVVPSGCIGLSINGDGCNANDEWI